MSTARSRAPTVPEVILAPRSTAAPRRREGSPSMASTPNAIGMAITAEAG